MAEQQLIPIHLTLREIALISKLRTIPFGKIEVHKENGVIERVIINKSEAITDRDGITEIQRENRDIAIIEKTVNIEAYVK